MGFVRVSGYNQTDLDNAYAQGVAYADGRSNPSSVNYQSGYSAGATYVAQHSVWVTTDLGMFIPSDRDLDVNVHIYNNTSNTLKILVYASLQGDNTEHTMNGVPIPVYYPTTHDFPPNGDLYFYQEHYYGTDNPDGRIYLAVIGEYSSYQNLIVMDLENDRTTGSCTFS